MKTQINELEYALANLIKAAEPFTSDRFVDKTTETIPLMYKLDETITQVNKLLPKEKAHDSLDDWEKLHKWYKDGNEIVSEFSGASVTSQAVSLCDVVDWLQEHRKKVLEILDGKYS